MSHSIPEKQTLRGGVILFHGVLNPRYALWPLQRRFRRAGFQVLNCRYQSWGKSIDQIVEVVAPKCQYFQDQLPDNVPLYIVGHSLGAIVCRKLLQEIELPQLKRVVMLAPPNRGSHVASRLAKYVRWLVPSLEELADNPESYVNCLPTSLPVEFGVIAADPDYVIRSECTHLESESDYIVEPGPHSAIIFRKPVFEHSLHCLEHGRFKR
ncbi:MAG: hypothetical protein HON04_19890 [Planctomicrobium sp.]|jgi:hypothetical protein|nr:hypothetical protein [Planctomicrobium sp.]